MGKAVADIKDADVAKELELGKEADTSETMEACTAKATSTTGTAAEIAAAIQTKTRKCVTDVETHVAATEGKSVGSRRLAAMEKNKIKQRMNKAGVASLGKKMIACMEAADLETGGAGPVATAKTACKAAVKDMFTKANGKIGSDIKEGDVAKAMEDAAVNAIMQTNIATANAIADGETYTDKQKKDAVTDAINKGQGDQTNELATTKRAKLAGLIRKAGDKAIGDKVVACVKATSSDAAALAACDDANLMNEAKLATGKPNGRRRLGAKETETKDKRKAAIALVEGTLNAVGPFTADPEDEKVAKVLKRGGDARLVDTKHAIANKMSGIMKEVTGGKRDTATGDVEPEGTMTEEAKTLAKRAKIKVELQPFLVAKDGSGRRLADVTDEEVDAYLDAGAADLLDTYDDCADGDKPAAKIEIEAKVKKNQIARLVAAQYGADIKAADDAKTPAEKVDAPVRDEAAIEALMQTKFESVGGVKGTFAACKAEIKKAKDAYASFKDVVITKKE